MCLHLLLSLSLLLIDNHNFSNTTKITYPFLSYQITYILFILKSHTSLLLNMSWQAVTHGLFSPSPSTTTSPCWGFLPTHSHLRGGRQVVGPPCTSVHGHRHIIFLVSHTESQTIYILKLSVSIQSSRNSLGKCIYNTLQALHK